MTREELIAYDKWLTARKWLTGIIVSPEQAADLYLAEHSFPPAEGADEMSAREYLDKWMDEHHHLSDRLIGWSVAADFAEDFATLHAQKIADKMVEEKVIELLQQRDELREALINVMVVVKDCYPLLFDNEKPIIKQAEAAIKNTDTK